MKKIQAELRSESSDEAIRSAVAEAGYAVKGISEAKAGFSLFRA